MDDKRPRRAGLNYHELARMKDYPTLQDYLDARKPLRIFAITTKGRKPYHDMAFQSGDALYFGSEMPKLPAHILEALPPDHRLCIPMRPDSRTLNLSNAVAVIVYEAWRHLQFSGAQHVRREC